MKFRPTPKQALALWSMIASESEDVRQPMLLSKTSPKLSKSESEALAVGEFVALTKQGRSICLELTDKAWAWAADAVDVEIIKSGPGATALQGLLRRLLPFLKQRNINLAELFIGPGAKPRVAKRAPAVTKPQAAKPSAAGTKPRATKRSPAGARPSKARSIPVNKQIEQACLALAHGSRKARVRLSALRKQLDGVERGVLDSALIKLQDQGRLVLYRDDNTAALTDDDHRAALSVGGAPRHLVYLEA